MSSTSEQSDGESRRIRVGGYRPIGGTGKRKGRKRTKGLDSIDSLIVQQNAWPQVNFVFVAAFMVVIFIGVLVAMAFLGVFLGFSFEKEASAAYKSLKAIGDTMAKAANVTGQVSNAIPPVNWTNILTRSFPDKEDRWVNITHEVTRTMTKTLSIVNRAEEKDLVTKVADFTDTVVSVVTNTTFVRYVATGVDHAYWVMGVLQSEDAVHIGSFASETVRNIILLFTQDTHEAKLRRALAKSYVSPKNMERMVDAFVEGKSEVVGVIRETKEILRQIKENKTVEHVTYIVKQARDHDVVGKLMSAYDGIENVEHKIEELATPIVRVLFKALADIHVEEK